MPSSRQQGAIEMSGAVNYGTPSDHVSFRTWIGVAAALLGGFMAILDIQIVNSSLAEIQGSLGATLDEGSWISTSYLVAEIIIIPLAGWLGAVFTHRLYIVITSVLFLIFSALCGVAWNLHSMIVFRAAQGLFGGALIPLAQVVILVYLPVQKRPVASALFGLIATFAPTIGPALGGYLTEAFGWHWIFYLNLFPGVLLIFGILYGLPATGMRPDLLKRADVIGIATMAVGLGALEIFLEEGNRDDWLESDFIIRLGVIAVGFLTFFIYRQMTAEHPVLNLRLLARRDFGLATIVNSVLGFALYGSVFLLPLYLAQAQGYNALQIGETMMWLGIPMIFIMPFMPRFLRNVDLRILIIFGVALFATSSFMNSSMTHFTDGEQIRWSQIVRAIGQPFIMIPLVYSATAKIEKELAGSASGLFNMTRNLGGSVGIAVLSTVLTRRFQFHMIRLGEGIQSFDPATSERLSQAKMFLISHGVDAMSADHGSLAMIAGTVKREALIMAYNDCFFLVGAALTLASTIVLFLPKVDLNAVGPSGGDAH